MNVWCLFDGEGALVGIFAARELAQQAMRGMTGYGWTVSERWVQS